MPPTGYPQRIAHVPGPVLSPAFWGGSLFTFCAHYTLTDDARSHYGPQCACVLRAGVVAGHQVNLGDVYCHEIDYSGPYDNRAFFLPLHVSLVNLCRTHCHCSQILPINTIIPGDRRPAYSSESEGSASPLLRVSSSFSDGHSGSSVDIINRDLMNRASWEKSVKAGDSTTSDRG